jgi:transcriptional regulator with XRE-family HTH domain
MGRRAVEIAEYGAKVAENVANLREQRGLTLDQLSARLREMGRPIIASGISKIEQGERRVDADDLVALARALEVMPVELLQDRAHSRSLSHELALQRGRRALGEMQALADELVVNWLTAYDCAQTTSQQLAVDRLQPSRARLIDTLASIDTLIDRLQRHGAEEVLYSSERPSAYPHSDERSDDGEHSQEA